VERAFLIFLPLNTAILFICYVRNFIPRQTKPEPIIKTKSEDFHPKNLLQDKRKHPNNYFASAKA